MIPRKQQKFFKRQSQNGINASFNGKSAHNFITKTCAHTENSLTVSPVNNDADVCECGYMLPSPATLTKCDCKQHPFFLASRICLTRSRYKSAPGLGCCKYVLRWWWPRDLLTQGTARDRHHPPLPLHGVHPISLSIKIVTMPVYSRLLQKVERIRQRLAQAVRWRGEHEATEPKQPNY